MHSYCGFLERDEIKKGFIFRRSGEQERPWKTPCSQSWWGRWGLVTLKVGMAVTEGGEGRRVLGLCSLTKKEHWRHSRVLHGWRLGMGNRVYPLSCWEQLSFSGSLLSPVKQAHSSHWRWWDYVLLSGEKQNLSLDRGWGAVGPPWWPISVQPFVCLSAEHSEASFKRIIQPWAFVPWLLRDNFSGSRLIALNAGCNEKASKCPWR